MALRMATFYGPQAAQVNEELTLKSSLDLTLTQHFHDEDLEPWKVHTRLEFDIPWDWYYLLHFSEFSHLGDEPETVYEGCYKTEDTFIFAWSSILNVGHYRWFHGSIRQLPPNSKGDYLVHTIQRILNFLQL